MRVHSVVGASI